MISIQMNMSNLLSTTLLTEIGNFHFVDLLLLGFDDVGQCRIAAQHTSDGTITICSITTKQNDCLSSACMSKSTQQISHRGSLSRRSAVTTAGILMSMVSVPLSTSRTT